MLALWIICFWESAGPILCRAKGLAFRSPQRNLLLGVVVIFWAGILPLCAPVLATSPVRKIANVIVTDTIWTLANSPYLLSEDLIVADGVRLTVEPGVQVVLDRNITVYVEGNITAVGTPTEPIFFKAPVDDVRGYWGNLRIGGGGNLTDSNDSQLSHVILAGGGGSSLTPQPTLVLDRSAPQMDHLVIRDGSGSGLHAFSTGSFVLDTATIANNLGHGIYLQGGAGQSLRNLVVQENNDYGIFAIGANQLVLQDNIIAANGVAARLPVNAELGNNHWIANGRNEIEFESGMISRDLRWSSVEAQYRLLGDVTVSDGVTLTVEADVTINVEPGQSLSVDGTISAVGTITAPIIFQGVQNNSNDYWGSLRIGGGDVLTDSNASILRHVIIDGAGRPGVTPQPSLILAYSAPHLEHLVVRHGAGPGIHAFVSGPLLIDTASVENNGGHGIILQAGSNQMLRNLAITGNAGDGINSFTSGGFTVDTALIANNQGAAIAQSTIDLASNYRELTFLDNGVDAVIIPPGNVNQRVRWSAPRYLLSDTVIERTGSVTVAPATVIAFQPGSSLTVFGELFARGHQYAPITFTSSLLQPVVGNWQGIDIQSGAHVRFANCVAEFAVTALAVRTGMEIDACVIRSSVTGIRVAENAEVIVRSSQIYSNTDWGLQNATPAVRVRAPLNWWGATTGPQHTANPGGLGDAVSDGVIFHPWLVAPSSIALARIAEPVTLGAELQRVVKRGDYADYVVEVASGQSVVVEIRPTDPVSASLLALARFAVLPFPLPGEVDVWTDQQIDGVYRLILPIKTSGRQYFTVIGQTLADQIFHHLHVFTATYHLANISPSIVPKNPTVLQARGYFPLQQQIVHLCREEARPVALGTLHTLSNTVGRISIDLSSVVEGIYDLCLQWPDGSQQRLENALQVSSGHGQLTTRIETPPLVRQSRRYTAWLHYVNSGSAPLPAPLFVITATGAILSASPLEPFTSELHLLGFSSSAPVDYLLPGDEQRVPIYFEVTGPQLAFHWGVVDLAAQGDFPWSALEAVFRPAMPPSDWNQRWLTAIRPFGISWVDVVATLRDYAGYFIARPEALHMDSMLAYNLLVQLSLSGPQQNDLELRLKQDDFYTPPNVAESQLFFCPEVRIGPFTFPPMPLAYDTDSDNLIQFDAAGFEQGCDIVISTHGNNDQPANPYYSTINNATKNKNENQRVCTAVLGWKNGASVAGILPQAKTACKNIYGQNILQVVGEAAAEEFKQQLNGRAYDCQRITLIGHSFGNAVNYYFARALCPGYFKPKAFMLDPANLIGLHGIFDYANAFSAQESIALFTGSLFDEQHLLGNIQGYPLAGAPNGLLDPFGAHGYGLPTLAGMIEECCNPVYPSSCEKFVPGVAQTNPAPYIQVMGHWVFLVTEGIPVPVVAAVDPNLKLGWQARALPGEVVRYTIFFENIAAATAPAQDVLILDSFHPAFDWNSIRFLEAGFGPQQIAFQEHASGFAVDKTILIPDYRVTVTNTLSVQISASVDRLTGQMSWLFHSSDPATGLPPEDPLAGFLPPNDTSGRGEGYVTFEVRVRPNTPHGTTILNSAKIVFDTNEPLETPITRVDIGPDTSVFLPMIRN
jgi:hypothetical protein